MTLETLILAGGVERWHRSPLIPNETLRVHHLATAATCLALTDFKASAELQRAANLHDMHELMTGDMPAPVKEQLEPAFRLMWDALVERAEGEMGIKGMTAPPDPQDAAIMKLADKLAAVIHVRTFAPAEAVKPEWKDAERECVRMAWAIGPDMAAKVEGLVG